MFRPWWTLAMPRSVVWLGGAACLAYLKQPAGANLLAVRKDAIGWLGAGIFLTGIAGHAWSNVCLARGESERVEAGGALVTTGPFQHVRNPIYLAGIMMLLGVSLLYSPWSVIDLVALLLLLTFFHLRVVRAEEPALSRRFGPTFEEYCRQVPRWVPRVGPPARVADASDAARGDARRRR